MHEVEFRSILTTPVFLTLSVAMTFNNSMDPTFDLRDILPGLVNGPGSFNVGVIMSALDVG